MTETRGRRRSRQWPTGLIPTSTHAALTSARFRITPKLGLALALAAAALMAVGVLIGCSTTGSGALLTVRGADVSFTLQQERRGHAVSENGVVAPVETILAEHGANTIRLRVFVNPSDGPGDLASALKLAQRAKRAKQHIVLDLHYSDTWADRRAQSTPAAWAGYSLTQLTEVVQTYTHDVIAAFVAQDTPVEMVQIGNEVTYGMLWPVGRIYYPEGENWSAFAALLNAGARGAREGQPHQPPRIIVHADTGGSAAESTYFYDHVIAAEVDFDVIGLSYYPFWHGSLNDLRGNVNGLAERYDKEILVVETAYPWTLTSPATCPSVVSTREALPDAGALPPDPDGQRRYFLALTELLHAVPAGRGLGFLVWEPAWLAAQTSAAAQESGGRTAESHQTQSWPTTSPSSSDELCNSHANLTLFDTSGAALPALEAFAPRPDGT